MVAKGKQQRQAVFPDNDPWHGGIRVVYARTAEQNRNCWREGRSLTRNHDLVRHVIIATRSGHTGALPSDPCNACGGVVGVTHTIVEKGGWVLRRLACKGCGKKYGKWVVADTESPPT